MLKIAGFPAGTMVKDGFWQTRAKTSNADLSGAEDVLRILALLPYRSSC